MRSFLLSLALGAGVLGLVAASPSEAKAYWPVRVSGYRPNGYGTVSVYGVPMVRLQTSSTGWVNSMYSPGGYATTYLPNGTMARLWYGPSTSTLVYNSTTGFSSSSTKATVNGYVYSPFSGYNTVNVTGNTTTQSVRNLLNNGYRFSSSTTPFMGSNTGVWSGRRSWTMMSVPMSGGGTFSVPIMSGNAMNNLSGSLMGMCPNMLNTSSLNTSAFGSFLNVNAAYRNYVPAGFIK